MATEQALERTNMSQHVCSCAVLSEGLGISHRRKRSCDVAQSEFAEKHTLSEYFWLRFKRKPSKHVAEAVSRLRELSVILLYGGGTHLKIKVGHAIWGLRFSRSCENSIKWDRIVQIDPSWLIKDLLVNFNQTTTHQLDEYDEKRLGMLKSSLILISNGQNWI